MRMNALRTLVVITTLVSFAPLASAQTVLGQWNANNTTSTAIFLGASSGTNAASGLAAGY